MVLEERKDWRNNLEGGNLFILSYDWSLLQYSLLTPVDV